MEVGVKICIMTVRERFCIVRAVVDDGWIVQVNCGLIRFQICKCFPLYGLDHAYAPHTGMLISLIPIPCRNGQVVPTLRMVRRAA